MKTKRMKEVEILSRQALSVRDKALIALTILLLIVLALKSNLYDPYRPGPDEDITVIERYIEDTYNGPFYKSGLLKIRLIKYIETDGNLTVKLRRYVGGIFPIGDIYGDVE